MKKLNKQEKDLLKRLEKLQDGVRDQGCIEYSISNRFKDFIVNREISFWYEGECGCDDGNIEIYLTDDLCRFLFDMIEDREAQMRRLDKMCDELFDIKTSIDPDYMNRKRRA